MGEWLRLGEQLDRCMTRRAQCTRVRQLLDELRAASEREDGTTPPAVLACLDRTEVALNLLSGSLEQERLDLLAAQREAGR